MKSLANPPLPDAAWRRFLVEKGGRPWAIIEDARWDDMFWVAYKVVPMPGATALAPDVLEKDFWHADPLPSFRHLETNVVSNDAFAALGLVPSEKSPFVSIRALHPPAQQATKPSVLSRLRQFFRR